MIGVKRRPRPMSPCPTDADDLEFEPTRLIPATGMAAAVTPTGFAPVLPIVATLTEHGSPTPSFTTADTALNPTLANDYGIKLHQE